VEARPEDGLSACIDEDQALAFVQGQLDALAVQRVDEHTDRCSACRALLKEAVRAFRGRVTEPGMAPPTMTRLVPGDQLAGRYRIMRFIAAGGMGEVYEAEDLVLHTRIAVKTLAAAVSDDPQAIRRLQLELSLTRRITHPNVCRMFDMGLHEPPGTPPGAGVVFITMELVPGQSLGQRLREGGPLGTDEALPIVEAMVAALAAAHRAGIIHRDFKSDNVMLAPPLSPGAPPWVVVMDFGLARASIPGLASISTTFDSRSLVGTLAYMAPEQMQGRPVTPATDIYALGVVMFEMVTGELPFGAEPPRQTASRRLAEAWRAGGGSTKGLDRRWETAILRCLQAEPSKRYPAVEDVAAALQTPLPSAGGGPATGKTSNSGRFERDGKGGRKPQTKPHTTTAPARPARMPLWRLWPVAVGTLFLAGAIIYAARIRQETNLPSAAAVSRAPAGPAVERAPMPPAAPARPAAAASGAAPAAGAGSSNPR
jgi:serine/threonine protein kinase